MSKGKAIYSFALVIPLGYSQRMGKGYPGTPTIELSRAFGSEFSWAQFKVDRLAKEIYRVRSEMTGILTAQGGPINLTEEITGMAGDVFRLTYGQEVMIEGPQGVGLLIRISS